MKQFWPRTLDMMKRNHCHLIDLQNIASNINKYYTMKKKQSLAILDATKLNPVNLHNLDRKSDDVVDEMNTRINRLVPWLYNA